MLTCVTYSTLCTQYTTESILHFIQQRQYSFRYCCTHSRDNQCEKYNQCAFCRRFQWVKNSNFLFCFLSSTSRNSDSRNKKKRFEEKKQFMSKVNFKEIMFSAPIFDRRFLGWHIIFAEYKTNACCHKSGEIWGNIFEIFSLKSICPKHCAESITNKTVLFLTHFQRHNRCLSFFCCKIGTVFTLTLTGVNMYSKGVHRCCKVCNSIKTEGFQQCGPCTAVLLYSSTALIPCSCHRVGRPALASRSRLGFSQI